MTTAGHAVICFLAATKAHLEGPWPSAFDDLMHHREGWEPVVGCSVCAAGSSEIWKKLKNNNVQPQ